MGCEGVKSICAPKRLVTSRTDWIRGKNHDEQGIGKPGCDASMKRDGLHMKRVRGGDYSENHPRDGPNELLSIA